MRNYLSFGGGVNSVALYLLLMEQGLEPGNAETGFEAVYVWMPDWPETHEYLMMMEFKGYPVTVLMAINTPRMAKKYNYNLYQYCLNYKMMPGFRRWCTVRYKIDTLRHYFKRPAFDMVGISTDEIKRAKIGTDNNVEKRFPLIEAELDRDDCLAIINRHNMPQPIKSGCFFCPYQRRSQWQELRRRHPELYCKAVALEKLTGRNLPLSNIPLEQIVNESNQFLFEEMSYPPCECGL